MSKVLIVSGPVIVRDNKVLLNISSKDDYWKFCGGKLKGEGEMVDADLRKTAIKRAKDELGIDIKIQDSNPYIMYVMQEKDDGMYDVILVHWLADFEGEIVPGEMVKEWKWIPLDDLDKYNLAPNIKPVLQYYKYI
jgi:8-oxo-dGTP pyrophosphatase MutT (NUDIX family)